MYPKERINQIDTNANEEEQILTLLKKTEAAYTFIRKWLLVIFSLLVLIWLTILTSPLLLPLLYSLVIR